MFKKKKALSAFLACLLIFSITIGSIAIPENVEAAGIALSTTQVKLYKGYTTKLALYGGTSATAWKSSNPKVVSISAKKGKAVKLTAKKKGTAVIIAKLNGITYSCAVTVLNPSLTVGAMAISQSQQKELTLGGVKNKKSKIVAYSKLSKQKKTSSDIFWAVQDPSVLNIVIRNKNTVVVVPKKIGSTYVYAKFKGKKYRCFVNVTRKSAHISNSSLSLTIGGKKTLMLDGLNAGDPVSWSSSNPAVASVTASGYVTTVTGLKEGSATITAHYSGANYTCRIDVRANAQIPSYFKTEVSTSITSFKNNITNSGSSSLSSFIFLTDTHWGDNTKNSPGLVNHFAKELQIPFVLFGGDVITNKTDSKETAKALINDFYSRFNVPIISTTGNHDNNNWASYKKDTTYIGSLSDNDLYSLIYKKENSYLNVDVTVGLNGYVSYTDDKAHKVRYITFNYDGSFKPEKTTLDWITTRVNELDSTWTVVLFSHTYFAPNNDKDQSPKAAPYAEDLKDYLLELDSNSRANIAAWMVGHIHRDFSALVSTADRSASFNIISTNCDTYRQSEVWAGEKMTAGTATEQAFDLVQVDTKNKKLYLTRVGAGSDRTFTWK